MDRVDVTIFGVDVIMMGAHKQGPPEHFEPLLAEEDLDIDDFARHIHRGAPFEFVIERLFLFFGKFGTHAGHHRGLMDTGDTEAADGFVLDDGRFPFLAVLPNFLVFLYAFAVAN